MKRRDGLWPLWLAAGLIPAALLAVLFVWPVTAMLARGLSDGDGIDLSVAGAVLTDGRTWRIVAQTLGMAAAATIGCVLLGVPGAWALYRVRFRGQTALRMAATMPFVLPTVVVGMAFRSLGLEGSITAVVLAMMFFNYGLVVRTVGTLWRGLDYRAAEAAATLGAGPARVFVTVTLPQLMPAIAAAASLVLLFCSTAFGIVRTLGTPGVGTLETEIYRRAMAVDLRTAAVLSCLQLVIVALTVTASNALTRRNQQPLRQQQPRLRPLTARTLPAVIVTVVVITGLITLPLFSLFRGAFTVGGELSIANFTKLATSGDGFGGGVTVLAALNNSLRIATDATVLSLIIGVPLALLLSRPNASRLTRLLDAAIMLPLGVSAVTVGFGMVVSIQVAWPALAVSGALVPAAQAVIAVPIVVRLLVPALRAVDHRQREAAAVLGASPLRVLMTIDGAVLARMLGPAAGFAYALSLGEFGATAFLARPESPTLPVMIVRLLSRPGEFNYGMAMAGAVVLALLTGVILLLSDQLRPRQLPGARGAVSAPNQIRKASTV